MTGKYWLRILFCLFIVCIPMFIIMFLVLYILIMIYISFSYGIPFELSWADTLKYTKAACFTGAITAIGCWHLYYKHYKRYR